MKIHTICKDVYQFVFPTDPFDHQRVPDYTTVQRKMFNGEVNKVKVNPSAKSIHRTDKEIVGLRDFGFK